MARALDPGRVTLRSTRAPAAGTTTVANPRQGGMGQITHCQARLVMSALSAPVHIARQFRIAAQFEWPAF
jgi:hypothetical protein